MTALICLLACVAGVSVAYLAEVLRRYFEDKKFAVRADSMFASAERMPLAEWQAKNGASKARLRWKL